MRDQCTAYVITLRPTPGTNAIRSLRRGLKYLLRACNLHCVALGEYVPGHVESLRQSTQSRIIYSSIGLRFWQNVVSGTAQRGSLLMRNSVAMLVMTRKVSKAAAKPMMTILKL